MGEIVSKHDGVLIIVREALEIAKDKAFDTGNKELFYQIRKALTRLNALIADVPDDLSAALSAQKAPRIVNQNAVRTYTGVERIVNAAYLLHTAVKDKK